VINEPPITPPPELRDKWLNEAPNTTLYDHLIDSATQWGADQELEACVEWLNGGSKIDYDCAALLRAARRPKPPSAVAQAEALIERYEDGWCPSPAQWHVIREGLAEGRRALEALDD
jgi:hypothetical protein